MYKEIGMVDINEIRDLFLDKDETLAVLKRGFEDFFEKRFGDIKFKYKEYVGLLRSVAKQTLEENVEYIFENAESPIEKIFFNSLNIKNIFLAPFFLIFTPRLGYHCGSVTGAIEMFRRHNKKILRYKQNFEKRTGKTNAIEFLKWLSKSCNIPELVRYSIWLHYIMYYELNLIGAYHLSTKSPIRELNVMGRHIRPDIFIWVPSNQDFKLVVECDGFKYHKDKESFTKDRVRDRLLQKEGYQVLRFSGSEIYKNPIEKADELSDYLLKKREEYNLGPMVG